MEVLFRQVVIGFLINIFSPVIENKLKKLAVDRKTIDEACKVFTILTMAVWFVIIPLHAYLAFKFQLQIILVNPIDIVILLSPIYLEMFYCLIRFAEVKPRIERVTSNALERTPKQAAAVYAIDDLHVKIKPIGYWIDKQGVKLLLVAVYSYRFNRSLLLEVTKNGNQYFVKPLYFVERILK
ncbi:hypothetical protein [Psychromonas aquimarina]|uniref:hypothetical protein n=1 Tax=Psychromonas aquimarina TaxID=444919 RepID=UPI000490B46B|nr:hypothetical protein [Psychromonas aquimarina]